MRVLHVITDLDVGGAEIMLQRLLEASDRDAFSHEVVSLMAPGAVGDRISALGVPVRSLRMPRDCRNPLAVLPLVQLVLAAAPDVVQTWMYHADLLGGLAAKLASRAAIVWGIHNTSLDPATTRRSTIATVKLCARLSRFVPDRILCVSEASRDVHAGVGYAPEKLVVVPNGFDLDRFRPDPAARRVVRAELGAGPGDVLVGQVARVAPPKDHATFLRAAALVARRRPEVRFVLAGDGATPDNPALAAEPAARSLGARLSLLGRRDDVPGLMNALDVATLSSTGEAFPLTIGEAMSCGVPCVVSDVGDSALLVGDTGRVVPPRDPAALAAAWNELVSLGSGERRRLGDAARARIAARFGLPRIAGRYAELYRSLAREPRSARYRVAS